MHQTQQTQVKVAAFDYDFTLVMDKKDHTAPSESVLRRIEGLYEDGYIVAIFTNQKSISRLGERYCSRVRRRIETTLRMLQCPVLVFVACDNDETYRKPGTGMWDALGRALGKPLNEASSFFVGDAAGRPDDFSDCDRRFAENVGILFMTPEEFFV